MSQQATGECQGRIACGENSGYAHGCRGDACGLARLIWQRSKRGSRHPRRSKYDTPASPEIIDQWRSRLYDRS